MNSIWCVKPWIYPDTFKSRLDSIRTQITKQKARILYRSKYQIFNPIQIHLLAMVDSIQFKFKIVELKLNRFVNLTRFYTSGMCNVSQSNDSSIEFSLFFVVQKISVLKPIIELLHCQVGVLAVRLMAMTIYYSLPCFSKAY